MSKSKDVVILFGCTINSVQTKHFHVKNVGVEIFKIGFDFKKIKGGDPTAGSPTVTL